MAIAFRLNFSEWGAFAAGPQTSAAQTVTAGDTIIVCEFDGTSNGRTLVYSGSVNTPVSKITDGVAGNNNTIGLAEILSALAGSQTLTVDGGPSGTPTGDAIYGLAIEYSGVGSTSNYSSTDILSTTSPAGVAVTVPVGAVLLGFCLQTDAASTLAGSANGGVTPTDRQNSSIGGVSYIVSEWVGTGGIITPTWSSTPAGNFAVLQVLLTPAAGTAYARGPFTFHPGRSPGKSPVSARFYRIPPAGPPSSTAATIIQQMLQLLGVGS